MKDNQLLSEEKFWGVVGHLASLQTEIDVDQACSEFSLSFAQLESFIELLRSANYEIELESQGRKLLPPKKVEKFHPNFSLVDWLEFQAHYPAFSPLDIFDHTPHSNNLMLCDTQEHLTSNLLALVEEAITQSFVIDLESTNKNRVMTRILARRVVYLDGVLCIVGERASNKSLVYFECESIEKIQVREEKQEPLFSLSEVEEFISSMRSMGDHSERLVLKIFSFTKFQLNLEHQFFEKPCTFNNSSGDIIWAATVEPNEKIFDWIISLGNDVEIFESSHFKRKFLKYCESKLKQLA